MEWLSGIMGSIALIVVAIIETTNKRCRKREEARAARRARESRLSMELMDASVSLSVATAIAIEKGTTNGEMIRAKEKAVNAQGEYEEFLKDTTAEQCAKI